MKTTKFKPSEVGPIPAEWECKRLGQVGAFSKGSGVSRSESNSGDLPCIRYGEIYTDHNDYIKQFKSFISESVALTATELRPGDILFAGSGETKEEIGKAVAYLGGEERAYCGGDIVILSPTAEYDSRYLGYVCNSRPVIAQKAARGQGDAVVHIGSASLSDVEIPVPPLAEQKKIAEALSDVDALLAAVTTLIEKKRAIKQGAMQQLLGMRNDELGMRNEPIRRLAGFSGAWVEKRLGECGDFIGGGTPSTSVASYWGGNVDWYTPAEIGGSKYVSCSERRINNDGLRNSAARILPVGTILLTTRASIGLRAILRREAATNQGFQSLVVNESHDSEFMYYFLSTVVGEMECRASGSTFLEISSSKLKEIPIVIPPTLAEQQAIAAVLSDMDAEIAALEAKRAKYESVKQGMMQELLTGKTRLVG